MTFNQPLVTLIFLSYNNSRFLDESIKSLFWQSYSNVQIVICDDCSSDDSVEKINEFINRQDRNFQRCHVEFFKNDTNQGIAESINKCMKLAKGELCVVFASDDISSSNRVSRLVDFWLENGRPSSIFSAVNLIDETGEVCGEKHACDSMFNVEQDLLIKQLVFRNKYVFGCSHAWTREVFDKFGPLNKSVINEDKTIPFRSALLNGIRYIDEKLVDYRIGTGISAVNGGSYFVKLYEHRRKSALREFDDLMQNAADSRIVDEKCLIYIKRKLAEIELLLFLSKGNFVFGQAFLKLISALHKGARIPKATKLFFDYFFAKLKNTIK